MIQSFFFDIDGLSFQIRLQQITFIDNVRVVLKDQSILQGHME